LARGFLVLPNNNRTGPESWSLSDLSVFRYFLLQHEPLHFARGAMLTTFVMSQILWVFGARSLKRLLWDVETLSNRWLVAGAAFTAALQISLHFIPLTQQVFGLRRLSAADFLLILPLALILISAMEVSKLLLRFYKAFRRENPSSQ
jgi:P-type Ca2+ transporter type 2C